jgi:hypothetical protein
MSRIRELMVEQGKTFPEAVEIVNKEALAAAEANKGWAEVNLPNVQKSKLKFFLERGARVIKAKLLIEGPTGTCTLDEFGYVLWLAGKPPNTEKLPGGTYFPLQEKFQCDCGIVLPHLQEYLITLPDGTIKRGLCKACFQALDDCR